MNVAVNDINQIVRWFLHYEPMTHKKLQKLLYFCYGIYLARNNINENNLQNVLFLNNFEAWVHGPVIPEIYNIYKNNGITPLYIEEEVEEFNDNIMNILNETMLMYGNYNADELEYITHNQTPWKNARKGLSPIEASSNIIELEDIYLTFRDIIQYGNN